MDMHCRTEHEGPGFVAVCLYLLTFSGRLRALFAPGQICAWHLPAPKAAAHILSHTTFCPSNHLMKDKMDVAGDRRCGHPCCSGCTAQSGPKL